MTIETLEKIHELLKNEVETRNNALELTQKAYNKRKDDLEEIAAAADDMKDESVIAANRAQRQQRRYTMKHGGKEKSQKMPSATLKVKTSNPPADYW